MQLEQPEESNACQPLFALSSPHRSLLTYISSLQAGTLDEVLAEELRAEALSASSRGEGRGERTRSGASSTSALALGKRGSSSNILDSDLNDSFGGESSADSILTATGRKRRAAAALAATNVASPGTPSSSKDQISKDDTAKDKDLNISPGRANRKDRADSRASGSNIDIGEAMEMDRNEEESESRPSSSRGLNKRKRGTDEGEGENENGDEGKGQDEVEGNDEEAEKEGSSPKKAKRDEVDQDEENGDDEEVVEVSAPKNRSTRSSARGGSSIRQDQEETEDIDQDANTETSRNNRISLSPVSSRGGGNSKEKDASNPRTSSRLRGDSTAAGTSTPKTRARNGSNASVSSVANAANKSNDGNNIISPPSGRTTRAGGSTGRNSVPNSEKGKEKEKEKTEEKKRKEKVLLMLWQEVAGHRNANIFQDSVKEGVSMTTPKLSLDTGPLADCFPSFLLRFQKDAPDYYTLIRHPIDLKQIKASIKSGSISSITQLKRSLNQMFANALVYNKEGSDVHNFAEEMRKDVEEILEKHETDQPSSRR